MSQQTLRTFSVLTRWIIGAIFCLSFAFAPSFSTLSAASSIPQFFNYQGRLLTSGGTNVTDGTYAIKFSLYTQASGGTPIWTALGTTGSPSALNVTVTNGLFSVLLGDASFQSQNSLSSLDWDQDGLYLGITVGSDSEMTPRKKLSSVPFALNAGQLQGQYASSSVASTGGNLFEVHQTTADSASAQRTALSIKTEGTNNSNDFLIVGRNDSSDVFTVSRQGSVTTTGNLASNGNVTLGDTTSDRVVFNAYVMSDVLPATDLAYRLGDSSHRWLGLDVGTVTTTNLYATTVSSTNGLFTNATTTNLYSTTVSTTQLFVNGQAISSGVPATTATLQAITQNGATTTDLIYAFGGINTSNLTATGTTSLQGTTMTSATATAVTSTNLFSTYGTVTTLGSTYFTATQATNTTLAFTSASGSSLLVAGQNVCLANGTNCVNGTLSTLQVVTTNGNISNLAIGVAGVSSTGDILPTTSALFNVGSPTKSWQNVYASGTAYANQGIVLGTTSTALAGGIRWTGTDFEGNDGTNWKTLTQASYANSEPTGFPDTSSTLIAFTTSTLTFAIGPRTGSTWYYYSQGVRYDKTGTSTATITDTEGVWFFYFNAGTLTASQSVWSLKDVAPVAYIYWDATNKSVVALGDERHGMAMDYRTHEYLHNTVGTRYASGLSLTGTTGGNGSIDQHAQVSLTNGVIYDEDLKFTITHANPATAPFEQVLTPTATIPVYYRMGATNWRRQSSTNFPIYYTTAGPAYNLLSGTWSTSTVTTNNYVAMWIFGTDNQTEPVIAVMGQRVDTTLANAQTNNTFESLAFGTLPFTETKVLFRLIFLSTGTNTPKASLQEIQDLRGISSLPTGSYVASAHGALSGLLNDDHTQYALLAGRIGGQTLYGGTSSSNNLILDSTSDVSKGSIVFQPSGGNVGIGTLTPTAFMLQIAGSVGPSSTNAYDLGSATYSWRNVYASGTSQLAYVSSTAISVGGQAVCLADGTNCQTVTIPSGAYAWTDDVTNNLVYNTTSTRDVLLGGSTTDTAGFIFDKGTNTSTVIIGNQTGNANLLVGTTTYGGGLNSNFQVNGNDIYAQGMIGSQEGLFSATGVTVGTGSTIYGDGNLYKTTSGDFTLALNNSASNWRFRTGVGESFTVASTGNIGIGVSTPLEALDVSGTIRNVYHGLGSFTLASSTKAIASGSVAQVAVQGNYLYYTTNEGSGRLKVMDVTNPAAPANIGTANTSGLTPQMVQVSDGYAYVNNPNSDLVDIFDVTNPSAPVIASSTYVSGPTGIYVSGRYLYVSRTGGLTVFDLAQKNNPQIAGTLALNEADDVYVQGKYAYVTNQTDDTLEVVDVSNPTQPFVVGSVSTGVGSDPFRVVVQGRYAYITAFGGFSTYTVKIVDISNAASPSLLTSISLTDFPNKIAVEGRYLYIANYMTSVYDIVDPANPTLITNGLPGKEGIAVNGRLLAIPWNTYIFLFNLSGLETSSLLAHSAEVGSLSVLTNANIYNQLTVGGGLVAGPGGILSQGSLAISSTNTTSTFNFAVSSSYAEISNRLTVGGVSVCLANGTNCQQAGAGAYIWTDVAANNTIYNTTTSRDVLIGGSTTDTANFILDKSTGATSTVIIGSGTGNANLLVGTTTYGGGLNANFVMDGNDIFASGMIGSKEGLFSATGVTVGLGTTIYGDGNLYKTNAGDFTLALNNTASNWRFRTGVGESFTVASTGNIGIGVTTPLEALDVSGTIQNILRNNQVLPLEGSLSQNFSSLREMVLQGRYLYALDHGKGAMFTLDVMNPRNPVNVATTTLSAGADPGSLVIGGKYAYVANGSTAAVNVIDISIPASPVVISTTTFATPPADLYLQNRYLYVVSYGIGTGVMYVVDVMNPQSPVVVSTLTGLSGANTDIYVDGNYAYITDIFSDVMYTVDVSNPAAPFVAATLPFYPSSQPVSISVQGSYAYIGNQGSNQLYVVDISNPLLPVQVATSTAITAYDVTSQGRYVYIGGPSGLVVMDVSSSTNPVKVAQASSAQVGVGRGVAVGGKQIYVSDGVNLLVVDTIGIETNGLNAASAEFGTLQVLGDAFVGGQLTVGSNILVGIGGIYSSGALTVSATNTTSTFQFAVSSTSGEFSNRLTVGGVNVCLSNGANCPSGSNLWTESATNNTLYPVNANRDVLLGGSTTDTAGFIFDKGAGATSTVIVGSYTGNANLLVGTTTYGGGLNSNFQTNGNDIFAQGMIGSIEGLFSATGVTVGLGSTVYGDGNIYKTTAGDFTLSLNNSAASWRFRAGGSEALTIASTSYIGVGVTTPTEALDVNGSIQNILRTGQTFTVVTSTQTLATPKRVFVSGRYAYVTEAGTTDKLQIFDVTNVSSPTSMGSVAVGDNPASVYVANRYAYVMNQSGNSMSIVDVSIPAAPTVAGTYALSGGARDIQVSGKYAYLAQDSAFDIVDISDPANPIGMSTVSFGSYQAAAVWVSGRYAYLGLNSGPNGKLAVVDISNPGSPYLVTSSTITCSDPRHVEVVGRYAYINGNDPNQSIVDISNPASPTEVSAVNVPLAYPTISSVQGRYWYIRSGFNGNLIIYDVSNPASPVSIATQSIAGSAGEGAFVSGRYLYSTAETTNELVIVDVKGTETNALVAASAEVGSLQILTNGTIQQNLSIGNGLNVGAGGIMSLGALAVSATNTTSTFLYAVSSTYGMFNNLLTVDGRLVVNGDASTSALEVKGNISNILQSGQTFSVLVTTSTDEEPQDIDIAGRYAFIVNNTSDTLQVFDFSNPSNPSLVSRTNLSSSKKVAVSGNFAYILGQGGDNTLKVVDISRIGAPVQVATTTIGTDASDLAVSGKYVYITHTNSDDLYVMDVSNPTNPTVAGTVALGGDGQGVVIGGKYAYVALSNLNQVKVVDISNPGAPTVVTTVAVGGFPYAPVIQGRYLYVDNYTGNSISIIDIGNPLTASVIATSTGYNGPGAMSVAGRYMYVPNYGSNYVNIVDISVPTSTVILATTTVGTSPIITALSGRYLFAVNQVADSLSIVDVKGIETNGLMAASAEVGSLQVLTNGIVGQDFTVNGALTVGVGGILSNGPLAVQGTSTLQSLVPMANNSYDLGTSSYAWRNAYSSGTFYGVDLSVASSVSVLPTVGTSFNVVTSSYQGVSATPNSVFVQGKYMYSANGSVGTLTISDISNPAAPSIVSTYAVGGNPNRVYVAGMYAYVSLYDDSQVAIVDISNPANPRTVGNASVSTPTDLLVRGKFMYVEQSYTTTNLLHIFDITDPTNPIEVGSVDTQHTQAFHIALSGNYLYTSNNGDDTISVIDIRNPFAPVYVTAVSNNSQYIRDFAVQGRYLYVGSYYSISIYDISNPALPTLTVQKSLGFNPGAEGVAIAGRYMYTANALDSSFSVIDVSSSTNPVLVTQQYLGITLSLSDIFVAGEYAYISAGGNGMVYTIQLKGTESAALIAHSAEVGSLQVLSNASIVGNLSVGGGLNIGPGGIMSLGSLAVASTNTTSTFAYAVSSTNGEFSNRLTVGGVAVCLQSGTNCPALPISAYAWTDSPSTNVIYNSTSTRDILMGGSTTATAGFIFDKGTTTSTVIVGSYTGNANLFVGTTTYGGGLNSNFTPNGNDIFAQGMIGSLEGLFSATGVTVGSGSTIYGDGYLYKTTAGDFTLSLNVASTSWRFNAGGAERLTVASSGNIGIGVATPMSALDINGSLDAVPHSGTVFSTVTTTYTGGSAYSIAVNGRYAYVGLYNSGTLKILDVSDASNPVVVGTATVSTGPSVIIPNGQYLYVVNNNGVLSIVDVSNPATPSVVSSLTVGVEMYDAAYSGGRLFIPDYNNGYVYVVNVSDPVRPYVESSSSYVSSAQYIAIQGRYAFVSAPDNGVTTVFDISNPASMQYVTEVYTFAPIGMAISGRYLYAADADTLKIVDISNAASPVVKATTSNGLTTTQGIAVSGKFAYVVDDSAQKLVVFDVSSSTSPVLIGYANTGVYPFKVAVAGRYAYVPNYTVAQVGSVSIIDIMGIETNGLVAASAEVGTLQVRTNGSVFNNFNVGGALTVGQGGIYTNGSLGVYATSTLNDSVIGGSLSIGTTSTNISERLQVEGNVLIRKRALAVAEAWNATGTSLTSAPPSAYGPFSVWTGSKMIVWSGAGYNNTGAIYDPVADRWTAMSTTNAPFGRYSSTAVWTGSKMMVWGGYGSTGATNTGGIYDPLTNSWKTITTTNAPSARYDSSIIWTGSKMIVWGGSNGGSLNTGAVYDPVTDAWTTMTTTNAPSARSGATAIWATANGMTPKMIVWTGNSNEITGAMYDPALNAWTTMSTTNAPLGRSMVSAVWTGSKMLVWGGDRTTVTSTGGVFDPVANSWSSMSNTSVPSARREHVAVWTGSKMIIWGGWDTTTRYNDGAVYDPVANSWTALTTTNAPSAVRGASAVWTGSKMIVWGGQLQTGSYTQSGRIYTPSQYQGNIMAEGDGYIGGELQVVSDIHAGGFYSKSGSDFAEYMPVDTSMAAPEAGDVVILSEGSGNRIAKSSASSRKFLVGAITNRPAVVGNADPAFKDDPGYALVSMLGQVDVKFSPKNGDIAPGDYLTAGDDGYAVRAKGPGPILGQALQAVDSTSSVLTYVNPQWWAGDLLSSEGDANFLKSDLAVSSKGIATSSTTAFGSNLFSFQGSAWDEASQSAVPTAFSMRNDTVSPTSSFFTLSFATGTNAQSPVLSISNLGDVSVSGDLTVGRRLYLGSKTTGKGSDSTYIYVDDTLSPSSTYIATNADGWQTSSTYDYAERYESSEKLNPGDLVTSDNSGINKVKRATSSLEPILGIVSTKPGFITGGYTKDSYPIALAGRVPTRVSTQNGVIQAGDYLTVSDGNPGLATKAVQSGNIVGIALESFDQPGEGLISVFVKPGYQNILTTDSQAQAPSTQAQSTGSGTGSVRSGLAKIYAGMREVKVTYDKIGAYPLVNATPYAEIKSGFWFEQVADGSFKIVIGETTNFDTVFSWTVQPSVAGSILYNSDNTYVPYDAANGEAFGPQPPEMPVEQPTSTQPTETEPAPADISTATSSDAAVIIPTSTMESPQTTTSTP